MTNQLLSELRKMRSTRTNLGLLAGMVALILLTVLLTGLVTKKPDLADLDSQYSVVSAGTAASLFAGLIGVMAITSEFRHGSIRSTFVVTPHRTRVLGAKVLASLVMGIVFGLAAIGLSLGLGYAILAGRGVSFALSTREVLWLVFGTPVMTAAWAALGVGFGAVIRNQVFAVIGLILWTMVVDNLLIGLVPSIGGYTLMGASGAITSYPADYVLSAAAGALLLLGYAAVFLTSGALLVARRDVT
jgi:ABC-2 type transport system permease protein